MHIYHFSIKELFSDAWQKTKHHYWFLFCVGLIALVLRSISHFFLPLDFLIGIVVSIGITYVLLRIVHDHTPKYEDLIVPFRTYKIPLTFLVTTILVVIIVGIGFLLLLVPGIYLAIRLQFYKFVVLDKPHLTASDVLKESFAITKGYFWRLFGFSLVIVLFNVLGLLFLVVGLFITIPVSLIAFATLYKGLSTHHRSPQPVESTSHQEHKHGDHHKHAHPDVV